MKDWPDTEIIVKVNGEIVLHIEPLDDEGVGHVMVPGVDGEERRIAAACLVDALMILTGPRPSKAPNISVAFLDASGMRKPDQTPQTKPTHLKLVEPEDKP